MERGKPGGKVQTNKTKPISADKIVRQHLPCFLQIQIDSLCWHYRFQPRSNKWEHWVQLTSNSPVSRFVTSACFICTTIERRSECLQHNNSIIKTTTIFFSSLFFCGVRNRYHLQCSLSQRAVHYYCATSSSTTSIKDKTIDSILFPGLKATNNRNCDWKWLFCFNCWKIADLQSS